MTGQRRPPGRATSFDIAQLAGVSQPTVSRALRGSPTVSAATRQRIEAIARELHYTVDRAASNLRSGRSRTLAMLIFRDPTPDGTTVNPFFLAMLGPVMAACGGAGYDLLVSFQQQAQEWEADYADHARADGLILLGYGDYAEYRPRLQALEERGAQFVCWGQVQPGQPGVTIGCDNVAGARDATAHLIAGGRRRIAFLGHSSDHYPENHDRHRGYAEALSAAGLERDPRLTVDAVSTSEDGARAAQWLLDSGMDFDGIVAASDLIALAAMRVLAESGRRVPQDVAVVGFDDIPAAALANPPLTTVAQDAGLAGRVMVETLLDQIAGVPAPPRILPARLVVRGSSGERRRG
ncbi:LacI family transcriptional regulator [Sphingomonas metalli]|uniref:LacI family transcriptional regulator n=1 Tax=Sphingomonas metalli TaxID=1779358 RepID=A0A916T782_9SPHN|nr:LacI family DNA-binding transcriptional regulator [Sphingomonas metalli]GGB32866.1 LacI family transcriptional regulator [Sphingomonas metalli]